MNELWKKYRMGFLSVPTFETGALGRYRILMVTWIPPFLVPLKHLNEPWPYYGMNSAKKAMETLKENPKKIQHSLRLPFKAIRG